MVSAAAAFAALAPGDWATRSGRIQALRARVGDDPALAAAAPLFEAGARDLPGPTGESNRLSLHPRGRVLCLGAGPGDLRAQALQALAAGNGALAVGEGAGEALAPLWGLPVSALDGQVDPVELTAIEGLTLVAARGPEDWLRALRMALAARPGPIVGLETGLIAPDRYAVERHLCIDTTAAGGNASLLATSA